ncbi:MAG TPA: SGNH/GDSL hydrolase family protein [Candidatus Nitrosotenuis sp.]|nr:SGNH/GDSL hydrolase family protein [Candidatus Nitrosotenuis sp.]
MRRPRRGRPGRRPWSAFLLLYVGALGTLSLLARTVSFPATSSESGILYPPPAAEALFYAGLGLALPVFGWGAWRGLFAGRAGAWLCLGLLLGYLAGVDLCMKSYIAQHGPEVRPHPVWSHEFVDQERWPAKAPGETLIVVVGDSTAYGIGLPPNGIRFSDLLAVGLGSRARVRVLNAAIPGTSVLLMERFARRRLFPLDPDLFILSFNNDPNANPVADSAALPESPLWLLQSLLYQSEIYMLARRHLVNAVHGPAPAGGAATPRVGEEELRRCYGSFLAFTARKGWPSIVLLMPREDVLGARSHPFPSDQAARAFVLHQGLPLNLNVYEPDLRRFHAVLGEVVREHRAILVDAYSAWKREGKRGPEYFHPDRLHLTALGHQEIYRMLMAAFHQHHLLERAAP